MGKAKKLQTINKMFVKHFLSGYLLFRKNKDRHSKDIKSEMTRTSLSTRSMVPTSAKRRLKELLNIDTR